MASSVSREEQIPISCNVCEAATQIPWKCIECDLFMCDKCKDRIHPNIKDAKNHTVVDITEVRPHTKLEPDANDVQCKDHKSQVCVMFCKSCDILVCRLCLYKEHKRHDLVEINEGYRIQIEKLRDGQNQNNINIDELTKKELKLKDTKKVECDKYIEAREKIYVQSISLKRDMDQYTEKLFSDLDQTWNTLKTCIEKDEKRATSLKKYEMDKTNQAYEIIHSQDVEKTFEKTKELGKYLKEGQKPLNFKFSSVPTFIPGEVNQCNLGSLQYTSINITFSAVEQYTTDVSGVFFLTPCDDFLWIGNENVVQKVHLQDRKLKVKASFDIEICGMAVTPSNDLLIVLFNKSITSIKQIKYNKNEVTDTNYSADFFRLTTIHVTSDYKILVGARDFGDPFPVTGRSIVISMDKEGRHTHVYEFDRDNTRLFSYPESITSTHNGNIFVLDCLSDTDDGRVVMLGQEGEILNIYKGHPDINTEDTPFKPLSMITTPSDNIIVPDLDTYCLHILNCSGHLIKHVNTGDLGIRHPFCLAFTPTGKVYIGCTVSQDKDDKAELYQVILSGC